MHADPNAAEASATDGLEPQRGVRRVLPKKSVATSGETLDVRRQSVEALPKSA